ncbi:MAG: class I SAM-dependent methyltransferase [Janthinobacterium lividum]
MQLHSPVTGRPLLADGPHSIAAGGERWPVLEGIPFLRVDRRALADAALAALDAGDTASALVLLLGDQDNWARTPPPSEDARRAVVRDAAVLTFREAMDRLAFGAVGTYFAHRWSDPTFLSGLALAEAHWDAPARVFELACGAGHYLREFARVAPSVGGADIVFAKLWLARRYVAPTAHLVCFDAAVPWPLADGAADLVFCHDAFYFLPEKPHVATEMLRVAGAGRVLVGHAHNALVDNLSSGDPLVPAQYAALFGAPLLYDDRELTAALVEGRAPVPGSAATVADAPAVAMAAGAGTPRPVLGGLAVPPLGAKLRRNPLYASTAICWPSERYEREYGPLVTYPMHAEGPEHAVAGADPATDRLARRRVLLDLPASW